MDGALSLLALLQLTDSAFPSGAFTHSYGLEQLARERRITTAVEVEAFVASVLLQSIATADAPTAHAAALAASTGDCDAVLCIDRALCRTKAAPELRAASLQSGRRLIEETSLHVDAPMLARYAAEVRDYGTLGMHPVAFGVVAASLGVEPADVAPALMLGAVTAMLQASMRLLPVSHRDVQGALHRLRPQIASLARDVASRGEAPVLTSFSPLQEIASMRHAVASARLFAS